MAAKLASRFVRAALCAAFACATSFALVGCTPTEPVQNGPALENASGEQGEASVAVQGGAGDLADASAWQTIDAAEAQRMMLEPGALVHVLDVRTQQEFDEAHIEGALLLPYDLITQESAEEVLPAKDETVLVYCRSGRRSAVAAEALANLGYTAVYDFGGINDWPYETVSGQDEAPANAVVPPTQ